MRIDGRAKKMAGRLLLAQGLVVSSLVWAVPHAAVAESAYVRPGPSASLGEIEACVSRNLPDSAGTIDFSVEAFDRMGDATQSRAEIRWRKDDEALSQIILRVSAPAKTAGTALLIVDRASEDPEFFLRLPEIEKVRRVRSKRLRGPVLGTDFSYEDLDRLRDPIDLAALELVGVSSVGPRATWLLETLPGAETGSEYARVLTHVDQDTCLPIQIDLYGEEDRLRKQLSAPIEDVRRAAGGAKMPHVFVMQDLRRKTHTIIRIEHFEPSPDLPAADFTRQALEVAKPAAPAAAAAPSASVTR